MKKKPRKPDVADEIAKGTLAVDRKRLAGRIRRAINAATANERKRIEGYIHNRIIRLSPRNDAHAALNDVLTDIDHGARPAPAAVRADRKERKP